MTIRQNGGGGGGFFLACEEFGRNIRQFSPRLRFFIIIINVEISSRKLIPFFRPG